MNTKKILAFILLFTTLATLVSLLNACRDAGKGTDTTSADTTGNGGGGIETDEYGRVVLKPDLRDDLNFNNQTVTFLIRTDKKDEFIGSVDAEATIINRAVYERNEAVKTKLKVNLEFIQMDCIYPNVNEYHNAIENSYMAGDNAFDVVTTYAYYCPSLAQRFYFKNLYELEYLNLEKPYWNQSFVEELTFNDQLYFIVGDITMTTLQSVVATFFNKRLAEDYYGSVDDIYEAVEKGEWTVDKLLSLTKDIYTDLDNNGQRDDADFYAFSMAATSSPIDSMLVALGLDITTRDQAKQPQLFTMNDFNLKIFEKLYSIYNDTGVMSVKYNTWGTTYRKFLNGELIFLVAPFSYSDNLRDMNDSYGILPLVKLDASQEGYYTTPGDSCSLLSVMENTDKPEVVGAVLEMMAAESYARVTPAYYEITLKRKYARDEIDTKMYDLILSGIKYNFGQMNSQAIDNIVWSLRSQVTSQNTNLTSWYQANSERYNNALKTLLEGLAQNE